MKRAELNYFDGTSYEIISLKSEIEKFYYTGNGSFVGTSFYITGKYTPILFIIFGQDGFGALYLIDSRYVNIGVTYNRYSNSNQLIFQDDGTTIRYINEWNLNKTEEDYKIVWRTLSIVNLNKDTNIFLSDENKLKAMQNINNYSYTILII